jgi:dipeptidyl aminopeptidase/acylaminoacyl peptidase
MDVQSMRMDVQELNAEAGMHKRSNEERRALRGAVWMLPALVLATMALSGCGGERRLPWSPTATPTSTATATLTPTPTPSPTPTPHPLSIDWLRQRDFAASPLEVQETLAAGSNYERYVVSYRSDGLKINAMLTVPQGEMPEGGWPAIVFNHGYIPPTQYRTTERYVAYVDAFARAGYVVLKSDYRGHGSSEGRASGGYGSQDYTVDVLHALAALKADPRVDAERIGMWGHSMGGWISLRAMVTDPSIRAGALWAGVVVAYPDLFTLWRRPGTSAALPPAEATRRAGGWRRGLSASVGNPEEYPERWAPLSANSYLEDLGGPIQLHHGTADSSVPVLFSEILDEQIRAVGGQVELFEYPGDDHNIGANLRTALNRSVAFFDVHVKGLEAAD